MSARVYEVRIATSADTAGLAAIRAGFQEAAAAQGLSTQAVEKMSAAYDALLQKMARYEQQVVAGNLDPAEAGALMAADIAGMEREMRALGEAERAAAQGLGSVAENAVGTSRDLKETTGHATTAAKGFDLLSNSVFRTAGGLRASKERTVLMAQAVAGLVAQSTMGADATQLLASGATNLAMIMSTGGPWGVAIGFAIQALATLSVQYSKTSREAEALAKKQADAAAEFMRSLKDERAELHRHTQEVDAAARAYDKLTDAQDAARESNERSRRRDEAALADQQRDEAEADQQAVQSGDMTPEEAAARESDRQDAAAEMKRAFDEERLQEEERAAQAEIDAAQQQELSQQKDLDQQLQRDRAAMQVQQAEAQRQQAKARMKSREAAMQKQRDIMAVTGAPGANFLLQPFHEKASAELERLKAEQKADEDAALKADKTATGLRNQHDNLGTPAMERQRTIELQRAREGQLEENAKRLRRAEAKREAAQEGQADVNEDFLRDQDARDRARQRRGTAAEREAVAGPLQAAQGERQTAQRELTGIEKTTRSGLEDMAKQVEKTNAAVAEQLRQAAATLNDGGTAQEMQQIGAMMQNFSSSMNAAFANTARAVETSAQQGAAVAARTAELAARVAALESQLSALQ